MVQVVALAAVAAATVASTAMSVQSSAQAAKAADRQAAEARANNARVAELKTSYIEMGMHAEYAEEGAWWLVTSEVIAAGHGADPYEAEAFLRGQGARLPQWPGQRWTRLRGRDYGSPGTFTPLVPVLEPPPKPKGRTAAQFLTGAGPRDFDKLMGVWSNCHSFQDVAAVNVHGLVREALGGEKASEWSAEDVARALTTALGFTLADGREFQAVGPRGMGVIPKAFTLRFPPPVLRSKLKDEAFRPWLDRINKRTLELRDDPDFHRGEELAYRMTIADRTAFDEALIVYAVETGAGSQEARQRFGVAGLEA